MGQQGSQQSVGVTIFGFVALVSIVGFIVWGVQGIFSYLREIPKEIAAPLITAAATVLVATLTVMVGRYFERKKELDALYRDKKQKYMTNFCRNFSNYFLVRMHLQIPSKSRQT